MSQTESSLERSHAGSRFVRYIIERNPVYLVSAMLMFAGIYLAIQPQDQEIGNLKAILATFGALEVYEFLLVGIIVFLVQTRRILDDAAKVFFVEAVCVIACFIILDELAFHAMDSNLSIQWGMLGLTLATLRFGFAGRTVPSRFSWTILVWLFFLFSWNAIAPALMGNSFREFNENREPAWLIAGWALNVLVLFLAPLALMEQRGLRLKERRLLRSHFLSVRSAAVFSVPFGRHSVPRPNRPCLHEAEGVGHSDARLPRHPGHDYWRVYFPEAAAQRHFYIGRPASAEPANSELAGFVAWGLHRGRVGIQRSHP